LPLYEVFLLKTQEKLFWLYVGLSPRQGLEILYCLKNVLFALDFAIQEQHLVLALPWGWTYQSLGFGHPGRYLLMQLGKGSFELGDGLRGPSELGGSLLGCFGLEYCSGRYFGEGLALCLFLQGRQPGSAKSHASGSVSEIDAMFFELFFLFF
jgi:hypothetical protein